MPPRATYRLQFFKEFGFRDAAALVPYLARLGISHVYASPILKARPGSSHGYDVIDYNALNPELGDANDFAAFTQALKGHGLGLILDFVPNHMGVDGADNGWWQDVLEWGQDSPFAGYFDIDWDPERRYLHDKLLVPCLGDQYGKALDYGQLHLAYDPAAGSFAVWAYGTHKLPICPLHYPAILGDAFAELERLSDEFAALPSDPPHVYRRAGELKAHLAQLTAASPALAQAVAEAVAGFNGQPGQPRSFDRLDRLIQAQHWRVAYFRVAADDINYRRFFNINSLAGLRMEHPDLAVVAHQLVFRLIEEGVVDGLRIDHIDGLLDPKGYCRWLARQVPRPITVVVEKILARHERLREDWPISGTTGYDFANLVGGLFLDPEGEEPLTRFYAAFTGQTRDFAEIVRHCKFRIMDHEMASELNVLARDAARIARSNRLTCDFTNHILQRTLKEIIARFPVYRTYVDEDGASEDDRRDIDWAVTQARKAADAADPSVYDFLHALLTTDLVAAPHSGYSRHAVVGLATKVQQYSGPVMAKGLEDTALYRFNRLVSLNEVGGHPAHFAVSPAACHAANAERARRWPESMLATSTHDTKRGEDARARLHVLAEIPAEWERAVTAWSRILRARRADVEGIAPPDRNDEYLLYQLLLAAWPAEWTSLPSAEALAGFAARIEAAMIKSIREAKVHSNWNAPSAPYEEEVAGFIEDALDIARPNAFLESFLPFQAEVARRGVAKSLGQTLLKLTLPGVPDIYQGAELWDLSLVDPDNRRPVDYAERQRLAEAVRERLKDDPDTLFKLGRHWQDGAIKLAVIELVLALRKAEPELFAQGAYVPLESDGDQAFGFLRQRGETTIAVAVARLADHGGGGLKLPEGQTKSHWRDVFSGRPITSVDGFLAAEVLFDGLPIALLV
jgi:(1->4)-alpha-D-glucan 1-alpha-D-glucosylmutase